MKRKLLTNACILNPFSTPEYIERGAIELEDGIISRLFTSPQTDQAGYDQVIDLAGKCVLPGMINAHHHLYSSLAIGMPPPWVTPVNFTQILEKIWWKLDMALDTESTLASFETGLLESLRAGVTTVVDHHSSPNFALGSTDMLVETAERFKVNIATAFEVTDRNGKERFEQGMEENLAAISHYGEGYPHVKPLFGLHASFTLSDDSLREIHQALRNVPEWGIHIHVAEDKADQLDSQARGYRSVVDRLISMGLLNNHSLVIHGIHCSAQDIELLSEIGATLVHNPSSNANNRVGRLSNEIIHKMAAGLGTDGMQGNMLREAKEGMLIRSSHLGCGAESVDYLRLLFDHNPRIATALFGRKIGHIEPGYQADFAIYDYHPRTEIHSGNLFGHILFGLGIPSDVMTRGEFRIRDGQFTEVSEVEIASVARQQAKRLWKKMG